MKIEITGRGIYNSNGEIEVGTVLDVKEEPTAWAGRYRVVSGGGKGKADKVATTGQAPAFDADKASVEELRAFLIEKKVSFAPTADQDTLVKLAKANGAE